MRRYVMRKCVNYGAPMQSELEIDEVTRYAMFFNDNVWWVVRDRTFVFAIWYVEL